MNKKFDASELSLDEWQELLDWWDHKTDGVPTFVIRLGVGDPYLGILPRGNLVGSGLEETLITVDFMEKVRDLVTPWVSMPRSNVAQGERFLLSGKLYEAGQSEVIDQYCMDWCLTYSRNARLHPMTTVSVRRPYPPPRWKLDRGPEPGDVVAFYPAGHNNKDYCITTVVDVSGTVAVVEIDGDVCPANSRYLRFIGHDEGWVKDDRSIANVHMKETSVSFRPTHPGETIKEHLDFHKWTQQELARRTGLTTRMIRRICNGEAPVSQQTSVLLERVFGRPADFWMRLQRVYDEHK